MPPFPAHCAHVAFAQDGWRVPTVNMCTCIHIKASLETDRLNCKGQSGWLKRRQSSHQQCEPPLSPFFQAGDGCSSVSCAKLPNAVTWGVRPVFGQQGQSYSRGSRLATDLCCKISPFLERHIYTYFYFSATYC